MDVPPEARRPLWQHALLLFVVLLVAMAVAGVSDGVYDADEGALLMQTRVVAESGQWAIRYPNADIDPDGWFRAVGNSRYVDGEITPFPVRPALVILTMALEGWGGTVLATMPGLIGLVVAAWVAGHLAGLVDPRAAVTALWMAGLTSTALFQALALQGHGPVLGLAALLALAVLGPELSRRSRLLSSAAVAAAAAFSAALIRREALMLAIALVVATLLQALRAHRLDRRTLVAASGLAGAVAGIVVDHIVSSRRFAGGIRSAPVDPGGNVLLDRLDSFTTLFLPGYAQDPALAAALMIAAMLFATLAVARYRSREDPLELSLGIGIASGLLIARLVVAPHYMVQGVFAAVPLGIASFLLVRREWRDPRLEALMVTTISFVMLIALTQYRVGGGFEWGTRYASIGIACAAPVMGVAVVRTLDRLGEEVQHRRVFALGTAALVLLPAVMGLTAQRHARLNNTANIEATESAARSLGGPSIVVSTDPEIPRTHRDQLWSDVSWFWAPAEYLHLLTPRLEERGVTEVILLTRDPETVLPALGSLGWSVDRAVIRGENPGSVMLARATQGE